MYTLIHANRKIISLETKGVILNWFLSLNVVTMATLHHTQVMSPYAHLHIHNFYQNKCEQISLKMNYLSAQIFAHGRRDRNGKWQNKINDPWDVYKVLYYNVYLIRLMSTYLYEYINLSSMLKKHIQIWNVLLLHRFHNPFTLLKWSFVNPPINDTCIYVRYFKFQPQNHSIYWYFTLMFNSKRLSLIVGSCNSS